MKNLLYTLLAMGTAAYALSPVDLVPDIFVGVGWVDDILIILFAANRLYKHFKKKEQKEETKKGKTVEIDFKDIDDDQID